MGADSLQTFEISTKTFEYAILKRFCFVRKNRLEGNVTFEYCHGYRGMIGLPSGIFLLHFYKQIAP